MAKVVLHIGTHKTATTTIQDMFAHNAALLARHGLIYPKLGRTTGHHGLAMDWNRLPAIYELPGSSLDNLRRIAQAHAGSPHTVFLSSEEFSRGDAKARVDFTALRGALQAFDEIEVICVLREQWQFIQSIYLEISKFRVPLRPPQLVETVLKDDMIEGLWTDYALLLDHLRVSFAPSEITFFDYDQLRRTPGGIIGGLLAHLRVPLDPAALVTVNGGRSNISPGPLSTWAANVVAEPKLAPAWLIEATTGAFGAQFGDQAQGCLWTRDEFRSLQDYARSRNDRLAAALAPQQPGFAVSQSAPGEPAVYREDMQAGFWLRSNRWTFATIQNAGQKAKPAAGQARRS